MQVDNPTTGQRLIEWTPEEELLRIVEREIHKKNKTSEIFRQYHPAQIAKFEFAELEEGEELGRGGFCVVRELSRITLEKDPHQEVVVGENRDFVQGFSESPLGMVLTGKGFWSFGPDVQPEKDETSSNHHFLSEERRQQMAQDFRGEDGEFRYAVKSVQESARESQEVYIRSVMDLALEAQYLSILEHPNIISMRGMAATSPYDAGFPYFVILEKLDEILSDRMQVWKRQMPRGLICCAPAPDTLWNERLAVAGDIARALAFLHDKNIIYRDLKCDNVGFVGDTLKLFDFGLAREMQKKLRTVEDTYQLTGGTGFFPYMSPEVALAKPYNESADVYSFAILLWEIMKVEKPFGNLPQSETEFIEHVIEGGARPPLDNSWPEELAELLQLGWSDIRTDRPSMASAYQTVQKLLPPPNEKPGTETSEPSHPLQNQIMPIPIATTSDAPLHKHTINLINRYPKRPAYFSRSLRLLGIPCLCLLLLTLENMYMLDGSEAEPNTSLVIDYVRSGWDQPQHLKIQGPDTMDFLRVINFSSPLPIATTLSDRTLSPPPSWPKSRFLNDYNASEFTLLKLEERQKEDQRYEKVQNKYYNHLKSKELAGIPEHEHCSLLDWQKTFYPVCNSFHEYIDILEIKEKGAGSQSIVFAFYDTDPSLDPSEEDPPRLVWKTQMWKGDYVEGFHPEPMKRRQIEARVMERGTSSPFLLPVFGSCGISTFVPYKTGHGLSRVVRYHRTGKMPMTDTELLNVAFQIAQGVADLHALNFVHLDLYETQWIAANGIFQLNDFNFGKFMLQDTTSTQNNSSTCRDTTFPIEDARYKSPEEIRSTTQTGERIRLDKADVFVMGCVLYKLITKKHFFGAMGDRDAYKRLLAGKRSEMPPADTVVPDYVQTQATWTILTTALEMCWEHDPEKRASAQQVADFLKDALWKQPEFQTLDPTKMRPAELLDRLRVDLRKIEKDEL